MTTETCANCGESAPFHFLGCRLAGGAGVGEPSQIHKAMQATSALNRQEGGNHYKDLKIQPIEYIHANSIPFAEGSIIKYVTRWRAKNGVKDLEKARHFIDLLIELETRK